MPTRSRPMFLCGGDMTPGPRDTDCPSPLHDHPLPSGYCDAAEEAGRRLNNRWGNKKYPRCGLYGWEPGRPTHDGTRAALAGGPSQPTPTDTEENDRD